MRTETNKLEHILFSILEEDSNWAGVPVSLVRDEVLKRGRKHGLDIDSQEVDEVIGRLVDEWRVDRTIAELTKGMEDRVDDYEGGPVWNLKIMDSQRKQKYESLSDIEKAVIKLLREQDVPRIGAIEEDEGRRILAERGFPVEDFIFHAEGIIRSFMDQTNGRWNHWFGLVWEHERSS